MTSEKKFIGVDRPVNRRLINFLDNCVTGNYITFKVKGSSYRSLKKADPVPVKTVARPGAGAEICQQDLYPGNQAEGKGLFYFPRLHPAKV